MVEFIEQETGTVWQLCSESPLLLGKSMHHCTRLGLVFAAITCVNDMNIFSDVEVLERELIKNCCESVRCLLPS